MLYNSVIAISFVKAKTFVIKAILLQDQDDDVGKVYRVEHSGRVRVLGVSVFPNKVFEMRNHFFEYVNVGSSSQNVEDLKKVLTLEEKLT
jgi:LPS O-antigen subunit length determinant protein (WzzB/FepE family)